ncbi:MAG: AMP-binding protein [Desulfurococcaceae archaeon]
MTVHPLEKLLENLVSRERVVPPSMKWKAVILEEYREVYEESLKNYTAFWEREARRLKWTTPWFSVVEGAPPRVRWFAGGGLSAYYNVVGKHVDTWIWSKPAVIWEGEEGDAKVLLYSELDELAGKIASGLMALGVKPGDWITLYVPPLVESIAVMLAAIRIGAVFEPVFTGFGYWELARRIHRRKPKVVFVADGFYRRGKQVDTLETARRSFEYANYKATLVVLERLGARSLRENELSFDDLTGLTRKKVDDYVAESTHPLFGLHSGYLEDFKPITHPTGGFLVQVYATSRWIGLRPHDTYFCTVWPGWITSVSYGFLGPLMLGSTLLLYDGSFDHPSHERVWSLVEDYAITLLLTTSSLLRILSKRGEAVLRYNMDTLRAVMVTAEPLEPETWWWVYRAVGTGRSPLITSVPEKLTGRIPVISLYIVSEIGTFVAGNLVNYTFPPIAPGSVGLPIPGFYVDVVNDAGISVKEMIGRVILRRPWPSMPVEYSEEYAKKWVNGYYEVGDYGYISRDGYLYVLGRNDGVAKSSGFRLSPGAVSKALKEHLNIESTVVRCRDPERLEQLALIYAGAVSSQVVRNAIRLLLGPITEPHLIVNANTEVVKRIPLGLLVEECSEKGLGPYIN